MQQDRLLLKAPAKINLYLKITGRRVDGYHTLESLMQKVCLYDELELKPCGQGIVLRCPCGTVPENRDNLVCKAAELFLQTTKETGRHSFSGVEISLKKNIPVAAGLGGGSSDAAATLKGLNAFFDCRYSSSELAAMGLQLGADVPFFLSDAAAAVATGIGEILRPVAPLEGYSVLLVNPGFPVSTKWVYQTFALTATGKASNILGSKKGFEGSSSAARSAHGQSLPTAVYNDLEAVTIAEFPEVAQLKDELVAHGADVALMSGSGPTVFGLFADRQGGEACYAFFKHRFQSAFLVSPFNGKD
jgi:4-diphosphocytidyl-2-C-methyl-D-erythritol kinase